MVVAIAMVAFVTGEILFVWQFIEERERSMATYSQMRRELETTYEIVSRTIREQASLKTLAIINDGEGVEFTGQNGVDYLFAKKGSDFQRYQNGIRDNLMESFCGRVEFLLSQKVVNIALEAAKPPGLTIESELSISGKVLIRN